MSDPLTLISDFLRFYIPAQVESRGRTVASYGRSRKRLRLSVLRNSFLLSFANNRTSDREHFRARTRAVSLLPMRENIFPANTDSIVD